MANMTYAGAQTVNVGDNVLFSQNRTGAKCGNIRHEVGSGRVQLFPGLYKVAFNANISSSTGGIVTLEMRQDGDSIPGTKMMTSIAGTSYGNVAVETEVRVNKPCCAALTVRNVGTVVASVVDAGLTISRVG